MKWIREILPKGKEAAFASGLLLLYAMELFLSPDSAWTMWAAPGVESLYRDVLICKREHRPVRFERFAPAAFRVPWSL